MDVSLLKTLMRQLAQWPVSLNMNARSCQEISLVVFLLSEPRLPSLQSSLCLYPRSYLARLRRTKGCLQAAIRSFVFSRVSVTTSTTKAGLVCYFSKLNALNNSARFVAAISQLNDSSRLVRPRAQVFFLLSKRPRRHDSTQSVLLCKQKFTPSKVTKWR